MDYLITNISDVKSLDRKYIIIHFNPWGFSKAKIESDLDKTLNNFNFNLDDKIYTHFLPVYFGNRSKLLINRVSKNYSAIYAGSL